MHKANSGIGGHDMWQCYACCLGTSAQLRHRQASAQLRQKACVRWCVLLILAPLLTSLLGPLARCLLYGPYVYGPYVYFFESLCLGVLGGAYA